MQPFDGSRPGGEGWPPLGPWPGDSCHATLESHAVTRTRPFRAIPAALLALLLAASAASAAEPPVPAPVDLGSADPAAAGPDDPTPEGRVIVVLRGGTNTETAATRARGLGARVDRTFHNAMRGYAATLSPGQARRLARDPSVLAIVPDERITGEDTLAAQTSPTGVRRVFGKLSAAARIDGIDQRVDADVAIYDTGIDPTHSDLNVVGGYNCTGSNRANWMDQHGHGTHVAGTVGAIDNGNGVVGVAPGVRLWAVRILDAKGEGYLSGWLCGLDWIAAQADPADPSRPLIEAVNMSVTRWGSDDRNCGATNGDLLHQAICRVTQRGITVVAAAANDSGPSSKRVPGAYNEVITVSALADTDGKPGGLGGNRCWSWGSYDVDDTFANFSNYGADVDLIAPGKCIWSTTRGESYGYSSGTSMAAPHVTGAVALYRASRPGATNSEVKWALKYLGNRDWRSSTDPDGTSDILLDVGRIAPLADFTATASPPADGLIANEAGATWSVPLALTRDPDFIEPVSLSVVGNESPLGAAITGTSTLWGAASAGTLAVTVPPATRAGTYEIVVRAAYRTLRVHLVGVSVLVENEPPVASPPTASLDRGSRAGKSGVPLRLAWAPATDASPIAGYQLGEVSGLQAMAVAATTGTTRTTTRTIPYATSRSYAVRAKDAPGNTGPWSAASTARVIRVQESSPAVRRSSGWTKVSATSALGGRFRYATSAGSWIRTTFTGSGIAVVGRKAPNRGRAEIRIDGVLVRSVGAHAKKLRTRILLYAGKVDPSRPHTIEVRVVGTAGHPRFDVDAFLVLR